jgi:hypothetical protein
MEGKSLREMGLCLELPVRKFISGGVMPDNSSSAAQPDSGPAPAELNFDQPPTGNSRIKRRSLKAKPAGLQPATAPTAARELEREAPPLSAESAARPTAPVADPKPATVAKAETPVKSTPVAPPRTKPTISLTSTPTASVPSQRPASSATGATPVTVQKVSSSVTTAPKTHSSTNTSPSPHGTRPATLYYSSYAKKESPPTMKTNSAASPAASPLPSSSATAAPAARPVSAAATPTAPRAAAAPIDYRANVERQSREQKSVGSLLSYVVYALIFVFVAGAALAGYGGKVIFDKLHDQSATLSDLDNKYSIANKDLTVRLGAVQDSLTQAQASINRQQDVINKQQEDINRLLNQITDNVTATKAETRTRAQETAVLRARIRDLEAKNNPILKY